MNDCNDCLMCNLFRFLEFNGKHVNQNPIFSSPHNAHWIEWNSIFLCKDIWHQAQRSCSRFCCEKSASNRQGNKFFTVLVLLREHIFFFDSTLFFLTKQRSSSAIELRYIYSPFMYVKEDLLV